MRGIKRTWWIYALPVLMLLAVTVPHLEQGDFRAETAHYGAIGVQAWRQPTCFWILHEHPSVPYFNKPPLVFWIHGLFLHLFGITLTAARVPAILASAGCLLFVVGLARRQLGRAPALATGVILALTYEYFRRTREISLDMWQALFMTGALYFWMRARTRPNTIGSGLAGLFLGLALLCKPLMALMVPLILIILAGLGVPCRGIRIRDWALLLGVALLTALPWHLAMIGQCGTAFVSQYFGQEVAARIQGLRNREPAWYYAVEIGKTYWPWMVLVMAGLVSWFRNRVSVRHSLLLTTALVWVVVWAIVLSLFPDKRPRYALPLYPMLAILAGYGVARLPWRGLRRWYRRGGPVTALVTVIVGLTAGLLPLRVQAPPDPDLAALTTWARKQDPTQVYSAALTSSDESMIYLKAGYWPTPLRLHPHPPAGALLIYTDPPQPAADLTGSCLFHQGPYRVIRR